MLNFDGLSDQSANEHLDFDGINNEDQLSQ